MSRWYLIENHTHKREELNRRRIPTTEITITIPHRISGIAFPAENKEEVLAICGLKETDIREKPTDNPDITLLELKQANVIVVSHENLEAIDKIEPYLRVIAKELKRDIVIENANGNVRNPGRDQENIYIFFYSVPLATQHTSFDRVFGIDLFTYQSDALKPVTANIMVGTKPIEPIPIFDQDYQIIAQVVGNNLYVLFDLPHNKRNATELLQKIMEQAVPILTASEQDLEKIQAELIKKRQAAIKQEAQKTRIEYIRNCKQRTNDRKRDIANELKRLDSETERIERQSVELYRQIDDLQRELVALGPVEQEAMYGKEFDRLLENPEIKDIKIVGKFFHIFTTNLRTGVLNDKTIRDLGEYRIEIPIGGGEVLAYNLTRRIRYDDLHLHHPHNFGGGARLCLGNISQAVMQLVAAYEFSTVAQLLIEFLKNPNQTDHYGQRVRQWPTVETVVAPKPTATKSKI